MLGSSDGALEVSRDDILEGSALGLTFGSTDGEAIGSDEGIILGYIHTSTKNFMEGLVTCMFQHGDYALSWPSH